MRGAFVLPFYPLQDQVLLPGERYPEQAAIERRERFLRRWAHLRSTNPWN